MDTTVLDMNKIMQVSELQFLNNQTDRYVERYQFFRKHLYQHITAYTNPQGEYRTTCVDMLSMLVSHYAGLEKHETQVHQILSDYLFPLDAKNFSRVCLRLWGLHITQGVGCVRINSTLNQYSNAANGVV